MTGRLRSSSCRRLSSRRRIGSSCGKPLFLLCCADVYGSPALLHNSSSTSTVSSESSSISMCRRRRLRSSMTSDLLLIGLRRVGASSWTAWSSNMHRICRLCSRIFPLKCIPRRRLEWCAPLIVYFGDGFGLTLYGLLRLDEPDPGRVL